MLESAAQNLMNCSAVIYTEAAHIITQRQVPVQDTVVIQPPTTLSGWKAALANLAPPQPAPGPASDSGC